MAYATPADVEARLGRELTEDETTQVQVLLDDAEVLIKTRVPNLDELVADGTIDEALVVMVECNMIIRLLRNPEAFISEQDGNYSYTRSAEGAAGYLSLSDLEWSWLLQDSGGMFQLIPVQPGLYPEGAPRPHNDLNYSSNWPNLSNTWRTRIR